MSIDDYELSKLVGLVKPEEAASVIAEAALDDEGIDVRNPSYHPARFAALRAAQMAIDFSKGCPEGDSLALDNAEGNDGHPS